MPEVSVSGELQVRSQWGISLSSLHTPGCIHDVSGISDMEKWQPYLYLEVDFAAVAVNINFTPFHIGLYGRFERHCKLRIRLNEPT